MNNIVKAIPFYLGCKTNRGKFVGMHDDMLIILDSGIKQYYNATVLGKELFLYLKDLEDITDIESKILIEKGIVIGRPYGYTFTNLAFLYLIEIHVDLFGFIKYGWALKS